MPGLRNVAVTAPYMHNGVFSDLRTVILFYNKYNSHAEARQINPETGRPWAPPEVRGTLSLTELHASPALDDRRIDALVAFLKTLTDKRYEPLLVSGPNDGPDHEPCRDQIAINGRFWINISDLLPGMLFGCALGDSEMLRTVRSANRRAQWLIGWTAAYALLLQLVLIGALMPVNAHALPGAEIPICGEFSISRCSRDRARRPARHGALSALPRTRRCGDPAVPPSVAQVARRTQAPDYQSVRSPGSSSTGAEALPTPRAPTPGLSLAAPPRGPVTHSCRGTDAVPRPRAVMVARRRVMLKFLDFFP